MANSWIFLTVVAGLASVVFNTLLRRSLRKDSDPTAYAWWFELIRALFFAALIPIFPQFIFSWLNLGILILTGLIEIGAVYFFMKMHSRNQLSLSTILLQLRLIYVPIIAFFVLGETLNPSQWLGIILIVSGAIIVTRPRTLKFDRSLYFALIAGILTATNSVILKAANSFASVSIINFAFSLPAIFIIPLLMKSASLRLKSAGKKVVRHNLPASAANIISMYTFISALRYASASQISGLFQGVSMLAVALGVVFLGERDNKLVKLSAAVITLIGMLLLV